MANHNVMIDGTDSVYIHIDLVTGSTFFLNTAGDLYKQTIKSQ